MGRKEILKNIERRLYAESMGRCMNPDCQKELFSYNGDIIEKAHIDPYCKTADNSFENLVVLCPNCHTDWDKNSAFSPEEVLNWKRIRQQELERFFGVKYDSFQELKNAVSPLLIENKTIFESYYLNDNKKLWYTFETKILINNRKIKTLLICNRNLFQSNPQKEYSNLECVDTFITHIDEFEATRGKDEKVRQVLFPEEINSIFGISPMSDHLMPTTESLEALISILIVQEKYGGIFLGIEKPYFILIDDGNRKKIFLDDTPQLRQMYFDYGCFRKCKVRLESINYALKYIRNRNVRFSFINSDNLREIHIGGIKMIFIYEYCLSNAELRWMCPEKGCVIVNLHNWNGDSCISNEAYETAEKMNLTLLTMEKFYEYIDGIKTDNSCVHSESHHSF